MQMLNTIPMKKEMKYSCHQHNGIITAPIRNNNDVIKKRCSPNLLNIKKR
ncbi:MAG: hypothetical protein IKZ07_07040 [Akkermansia sp.]|nr:hypothetical protein [Akkermansia sp.]